ncbi:AMP-binding enzyme [Marinobacterium aestuariivivens]|uniref:AMP-binding enzyme C-terminal domain-containing protein n=1 Tax=Marinobacterium aestuariivivens TaxID=1698799 RepID=A0ABW2A8Z6_9GAMM
MIKSGGEWVSSLALEDLIGQHPDVAAVAVVARPDPDWGECPHALVVARPDDDQLDAEAIRSHLQQYVDAGRISSWWVPREIELVDDIPRTSVGKIDKKAIRHRLAQS